MGLYEGIKDVAKVVQQADNVELYRQLLELSSQALDMQNEIKRLTDENNELKKAKNLGDNIERHKETYITLKNENEQVLYCSRCWDHEQKLVQVKTYDNGKFQCTHCKNEGIYDQIAYDNYLRETREAFRYANSRRNNYF